MAHHNRKFSDETEKIIANKYADGESVANLTKEFDCSRNTVYRALKRNNIETRSNKINSRKYEYDRNYFSNIDSPDKAYWLGFIYADGYLSKSKYRIGFGVSLAVEDKQHLEKLKESMSATYEVKEYSNYDSGYSNNGYCRLEIYGEDIYNQLLSHGVLPKKTDILEAPNIEEELIPHFIRGYIDGDGSIYSSLRNENTNYHEYAVKVTGTPDILDYIKEYIESNEVATINKYYQRKEGNNAYNLQLFGNNQVLNFLSLIYKDAKLYLDRKYEKYQELVEYKN